MEFVETENQVVDSKKAFSIIGWATFMLTLVVMFVGPYITRLLLTYFPETVAKEWGVWLNVGISFYCIGVPVFYLIMKMIPTGPKGEKKKMTFKELMVTFVICMAAVYIFNIFSNVLNLIIGMLMGGEAIANPLLDIIGGTHYFVVFLFAGILAPIFEELVFRGIMLDKLRGYGDKTAIFFTALTFGLFHGNLSQFFYAFALGLILGYIAMKTNTIKYTVILHMAINIIGSGLMPLILKLVPEEMMNPETLGTFVPEIGTALLMIGIGFFMVVMILGFIIGGIILYLKNIKKVELVEGQIALAPGTTKTSLYFNVGMILFYGLCLYMFYAVIFV